MSTPGRCVVIQDLPPFFTLDLLLHPVFRFRQSRISLMIFSSTLTPVAFLPPDSILHVFFPELSHTLNFHIPRGRRGRWFLACITLLRPLFPSSILPGSPDAQEDVVILSPNEPPAIPVVPAGLFPTVHYLLFPDSWSRSASFLRNKSGWGGAKGQIFILDLRQASNSATPH